MKPKQLDVIWAFMSGNDMFMSLLTRYGKSAIYVVLSLANDFYLLCNSNSNNCPMVYVPKV